eukprot:521318-Pleurochrysis_carterae.AAC.1
MMSVAGFSLGEHEPDGVQSGTEIEGSGARGQQTHVQHGAGVIVEPTDGIRKLLSEDIIADALSGDRGLGDSALVRLIEHKFEGGAGGSRCRVGLGYENAHEFTPTAVALLRVGLASRDARDRAEDGLHER